MRSRILFLLGICLFAFISDAATFTVINTNDLGAGSLRQAILDANGNVGMDTIAFNIPGAGVHTIAPASALPDVLDPVILDGWSQPGFTNSPLIEIDGSSAGAGVSGFHFAGSSDGSTMRGLIINGFSGGSGARTDNTDNYTFHGNWFGLDADGTTEVPNLTGLTLFVSLNNIVGGTGPNQRNVFAGNGGGGAINGNGYHGTTIRGNYIGTDVTGLLDRNNNHRCITVFFTDDVTIGGLGAGEGNVIGGGSVNIDISGNSDNTQILGNFIGVGADGTTPLSSSTSNIDVHPNAGDSTLINGNVIANAINIPGNGISVYNDATSVQILNNRIFNNFGLGIDLNAIDGVSLNDTGDPDTGENLMQNFPVLASATEAAGIVTITGTLNSTPLSAFSVQYFSNTVCDPSGYGEGETYLGSQLVNTDASGNGAINAALAAPATGFITATATDSAGNTSEFSACVAIVSGAVTGTAQFTSASYTFAEGSPFGSFAVSRTGGTEPASVQYTVTNGSATNGSDFNALASGTVTWAANDTTTKIVSFTVSDDAAVEGAENFTVALSNPANIALGSPSNTTVTINDNDFLAGGQVQFTQAATNVNENAGSVTIFVSRTGGSSGAVSVDYSMSNGTADGGDYTATSGTLNWANGDTANKSIVISITNDLAIEGSQNFTVTLSNPSGVTLGSPSSEVVTILDDDSPGTFAFSSATYNTTEAAGTVLITVNRTGGASGTVSVDYATAPGSAVVGDYTTTTGTLTWTDGDTAPKSFSVPIANDGAPEPAEQFTVTLSNPTGGGAIGSPATATVTIAASAAAVVEAIPTASTTMLMLLGVVLGVVAVVVLKR